MDKDFNGISLMQGDCLEKMKDIPNESINLILTDPPYSLGYDFENDDYEQYSFSEIVKVRIYDDFEINFTTI